MKKEIEKEIENYFCNNKLLKLWDDSFSYYDKLEIRNKFFEIKKFISNLLKEHGQRLIYLDNIDIIDQKNNQWNIIFSSSKYDTNERIEYEFHFKYSTFNFKDEFIKKMKKDKGKNFVKKFDKKIKKIINKIKYNDKKHNLVNINYFFKKVKSMEERVGSAELLYYVSNEFKDISSRKGDDIKIYKEFYSIKYFWDYCYSKSTKFNKKRIIFFKFESPDFLLKYNDIFYPVETFMLKNDKLFNYDKYNLEYKLKRKHFNNIYLGEKGSIAYSEERNLKSIDKHFKKNLEYKNNVKKIIEKRFKKMKKIHVEDTIYIIDSFEHFKNEEIINIIKEKANEKSIKKSNIFLILIDFKGFIAYI